MVDSLRSLAGTAFRTVDVIDAFRPVIKAEDAVLATYTFLPHARSGISAALTTPFRWQGPTRTTVEMSVPVNDDRPADQALRAAITVHVFGPADVAELDARQVIRTWPKADAHDVEVDDLVQVEFDRPELPWLFTPAGPDAGRLVPWLTLVVARADAVVWTGQRGALRTAEIRRNQLQPLGDAWAWAHAQVVGPKDTAAAQGHSLDVRVGGENAAFNLSRVVCPRRLAPQTAYVACVVPTFRAGNQRGLGITPETTLEPSWGTAADFSADDPESMVPLAVYYSWGFATGEGGNFESLARLLRPKPAPPGVGRRRVDATQPWLPAPLTAADPGAEMVVNGPIVSLQETTDAPPEEHWPDPAAQVWSAAVTDALVERVNLPDRQAHAPVPDPPPPDPTPPLVGPPLYGSNHARQSRIETTEPTMSAQPTWFRELNLDPRDRIVGGLGTRVVQAEQEGLMAEAWNQVAGVESVNRALRLAQLAQQVNTVLHRRHLARLSEAAVFAATERVHPKVLAGPARSVLAAVDVSSLPPAVTTGAFRRLTRLRGPIATVAKIAATPTAVEALTVRADHLTTDWVLIYANPDAVDTLGAEAKARITARLADRVAPGVDRDTLLAGWDDALAGPGPEEVLSPDRVAQGRFDPVDLSATALPDVLRRLLATVPSAADLDRDDGAALAAGAAATHLERLAGLAEQLGLRTLDVVVTDAKRLELPVRTENADQRHVVVELEALRGWARQLLSLARRRDDSLPFDAFAQTTEQLAERLLHNVRLEPGQVAEGFAAIADRIVVGDKFAEAPRARLDVAGLDLLAKLDPRITVPARIRARLTQGTGTYPGWLRPDWFDDLRIEPVMACPRFPYPMYEPLDRYEREWMIPGLGLIKAPDMATLLRTNSRFVEAYLVGLNHEMSRELLWREYPTDQRGTYFSSFWSGRPELKADLHEPVWQSGGLSSHVLAELDGQIVFLVRGDLIRRYPGVVAHAVRQAQEPGSPPQSVQGVPVLEPGTPTSPKKTLFHLHLPPNVLLVGFALTEAEITDADDTWWFTLSENPSEPRFGLDESRQLEPPPGLSPPRDDLVWTDFGVPPEGFLRADQPSVVHARSLTTGDESRWGASSAAVAYLLFQLPARAAFKATSMLSGVNR
ncbi:MAG: hypothetical protein ACR2LI_06075 [Propionibacteriaceae bacterium]